MESNISSQVFEDVELREFLVAALAVLMFMALFLNQVKVYDLSTAMFFAYGLGALARGKMGLFYGLFPLACLNRETTLLMSVVYAVWFWRKLGWGRYLLGGMSQAVIFGLIRFGVMVIYARNPGMMFLFRPLENIHLFLESPALALIHWGVFVGLVWWCVRRWGQLPAFVRVSFAVLLPLMLVNYLVLGVSYEVRVFADLWAVAVGCVESGG